MLTIAAMFQVTRVRNYLLAKRVDFYALDTMAGDKDILVGGHDMRMMKRGFHFSAGSTTTLTYPAWAGFEIGQRVDLSRILNHPSVPLERAR